jgi:alkylation response protein AidB-like acyl-CoA dehydrogenase
VTAELTAALRRLVEDLSPEARVREVMETDDGFDAACWARLGALGYLGMAIPERYGGGGQDVTYSAALSTELGRGLTCVPYLSSVVLGAGALLAAGDEESRARHLPAIAAGRRRVTLALPDLVDSGAPPTVAARNGVLDGHVAAVLDGHTADLLLVVTADGVWEVAATAPGLTRRRLATLDRTRRLARVELRGVPARRIGAVDALGAVRRRALVHLTAEQAGGAQTMLETAVAYAKTRVQFGRPIGGFQAVKHLCADMFVAVESARATAEHAAAHPDDEMAASLAKAVCSEAYATVATDAIQVLGGIGFTWEHPAHLYLRRARSDELLFGDPARHYARLAGSPSTPATARAANSSS